MFHESPHELLIKVMVSCLGGVEGRHYMAGEVEDERARLYISQYDAMPYWVYNDSREFGALHLHEAAIRFKKCFKCALRCVAPY